MKILYVGTYVDSNNLKKLKFHSVAANVYQQNFLKSVSDYNNEVKGITIRSTKFLSDKFFIKGSRIKFKDNASIYLLPVINFPIIKQFLFSISILFHSFSWSLRFKGGKKVIVLFNTFSYMFLPLKLISLLFNIKLIGLILDVPSKNVNIFKKIIFFIEYKFQILFIKLFDKIIVITKNIATDFAPNKPFIVIEGFIDENHHPASFVSYIPNNFNVTYTGLLNENSGILNLIKLFLKNNYKNISLNIYGYGIYSSEIKMLIKESENIKYHGYVSYEESILAQKNADILVIPRLPDNFLTKYTFPSKVIEYTTSKKPIIINNLNGIDFTKYNYLNVVNEPNIENWNKILLEITSNYAYYSKNAYNGYNLILNKNDSRSLGNQINNFIKS